MNKGVTIVRNEYVDRNGTKHQEVETDCDRCGGAGQSDKWYLTGKVCFKCGGDGRMLTKRKEYTPEHEEKLRKQREKRAEKKRLAAIAQAEEENQVKLTNWGYNQPTIHLVLGDTFSIKDELKSAGARFNNQIRGWYFSEKPGQWDTVELETAELLKYNYLGQVDLKYFHEVQDYINEKRKEVEPQSSYVGSVGEKIEIEVEFITSFLIESTHFIYSDTFINKMQDEQGNIFIWKTSKNLKYEKDDTGKIRLKGTIKEHTEFRGEQQTILTRCRLQKGS
ncbi:hypothetical protein QRD86_00145 (plasmid) [Bacillus halotolerans]|uniref:hypothetical protein n=1 Tax=Bacillus halotolerans TaxID=260554 RepID=UPI0025710168|nr:hypothetical protein [Bacillus halotolerans]WJE41198.1 hypothetical protein QRD86_00145 [Bacillus halotolerans]